MKKILLRGIHARGQHTFAVVDDEMFDELNVHKWKAKPNGSGTHVYAIRVMACDDGKHRDIRMHRVVVGYSGPLDIDHINRNTLDNRRANLRIATRSANQLNRRRWVHSYICVDCGLTHELVAKESTTRRARCDACIRLRYARVPLPKPERSCEWCARTFASHTARFCSDKCRKLAKKARQSAVGHIPPSRTAEWHRTWRANKKAVAQ